MAAVPCAIEVLIKKASVDPEFRQLLLDKRGQAARKIDLQLTDAERNMLSSIPTEQLERIIDSTKVEPEHRAVFLGAAGKLMLAVVIGGAFVAVMMPSLGHRVSFGISPERIRKMQMERYSDVEDANDPNEAEPASEDSEGDQGN